MRVKTQVKITEAYHTLDKKKLYSFYQKQV